MNCRKFQDQIFEYVEGSLSAGARAAAARHLAGCGACREAVRAEEALMEELCRRLRQGAETLKLCPEIRGDILAAARREPAAAERREFLAGWRRLAAPLGVGAAALVLGAVLWLNLLPGAHKPGAQAGQLVSRDLPPAVSLQLFSCETVLQFRREGNAVIDTLSPLTVVVSVNIRSSSQQ